MKFYFSSLKLAQTFNFPPSCILPISLDLTIFHSKVKASMVCMKLKCRIQCLLALEFLLLAILDPLHFMAQGRQFSKLSESTMRIKEEKMTMMMRPMIGSKPPRCDNKRCRSCGNCEAVQVPVVPSKEFIINKHADYFHALPRINIIAYSRGNYISNYKPMCWKCKCGNLFFNP